MEIHPDVPWTLFISPGFGTVVYFIWSRKISGAAARIERETSRVESSSREKHIYNLCYRYQSFEKNMFNSFIISDLVQDSYFKVYAVLT